MTIQDQVNSFRNELLNSETDANRLAEILVQLSALSGNVANEIIEREFEYSKIYNLLIGSDITAAKAKVTMSATPEYLAYKKAKAVGDMVTQMIGSIKYLIKVKENEYRNSKTQ